MRIILCGFGVVGQSLANLLESRAADLYVKYGLKPRIVAVSDRRGIAYAPSGLNCMKLIKAKNTYGTVARYDDADDKNRSVEIIKAKNTSKASNDAAHLIETVASDADVLVETTPSNYVDAEPGMSNITSAMKHGMHVVSVNKGPLALAFPSLNELAAYNQVMFRFSGTVGGGTPILDYAKNSLCGEQITSFSGILNGTTNYMLSRMASGMSPKAALSDARKKGYVEADESLDLDGLDAAAKLVILANWIMDMKVTMPDVRCTGIRGVTSSDIKKAAKKDMLIKMTATCDSNSLSVAPVEIPKDDPLCVNGTLNAISFTSEHSGTQTIIGCGAGGTETASAILRDLLYIRQRISSGAGM